MPKQVYLSILKLHVMDQHNFKGNDIPHIKLDPNMSIEDW